MTPLANGDVASSPPPSTLTDPYPLPLSSSTLKAGSQQSLDRLENELDPELMPLPLERKGEDEDKLRARLVYQTRKRGTLEADLILSTFAKENLSSMSVAEMQEFDKVGLFSRI